MSLYTRVRITYNDASPTSILQMFADSFDRLTKSVERVRAGELPDIQKGV
jgi:hypothetical protein